MPIGTSHDWGSHSSAALVTLTPLFRCSAIPYSVFYRLPTLSACKPILVASHCVATQGISMVKSTLES